MGPFVVRWGWCNGNFARFPSFESAIGLAGDIRKGEQRRGFEAPTVANTDREDIETDGLTAEQREDCEAVGLEVRRP